MSDAKDLTIQQGKTFALVARWETAPVIRKLITAVSLTSGAPRLSVAAHGALAGWRGYVSRAQGMPQLNAENYPPRASDYHEFALVDADTIEFNSVDPVDASGREWPAYTAGGFLCWNTPVDLTGFSARMSICDRPAKGIEKTAVLWQPTTAYAVGQHVVSADGSTVLAATTAGTSSATRPTAAGTDGTVAWAVSASFVGPKELYRLTSPSLGIVVDNALKTITLSIAATTTGDFAWRTGVYELEMVGPTGIVTTILSGKVAVAKEVTV